MTPSRFTGKCKWVHFLKAIFLLCNSQINPLTFNRKNKTETPTEMADEAGFIFDISKHSRFPEILSGSLTGTTSNRRRK